MQYGAIPATARETAKLCMLDTFGVACAGHQSQSAQIITRVAQAIYGNGTSTIWVSGKSISAPGSAMANAAAAHALDFDDNCYAGTVHGSAVVFPAAMAMAQRCNSSGRQLLEAFIVGLECEFAFGNALGAEFYARGWWTTSLLGAIGAAAASARLLGLDEKKTSSAIALAAVGAGAVRAVRGTNAKHIYCGRAAERGVIAALLAAEGSDAPSNVVEDKNGISEVLNGGQFDRGAIEKIGLVFGLETPGIDFKKYPICYAGHAAADAMKRIMRDQSLNASDIASVECTVPPLVASNMTFDRPKNAVQAQFSLEFAIAAIQKFGKLNLEHLDPSCVQDAVMNQIYSKITIRVSDTIPNQEKLQHDFQEWAHLSVSSTDGQQHDCFVGAASGSARDPMPDSQHLEKFLSCVAPIFGEVRSVKLARNILDVEQTPSISDVFE
ncbi:MAG: MmgE/PrpD family protein [Pseudomonadota bacterium]